MAKEKKGKLNKNFYVPAWIADKLDSEADRYDGPGVVVSAALLAFCDSTNEQKRQMLKEFRQAEIDYAYNEAASDVVAAEELAKEKKQSRNRRSPKAS